MTHPEQQYLDLIRRVLDEGHYRPSPHQPLPSQPNPPGTLSIMNANMTFDLSSGVFPLMTVRKISLRAVVAELVWFLSGSTNTKDLEAHLWDPWDTPETNQAMGWGSGQLGPIYGKQWRHWGARMRRPDGAFIPVEGEMRDHMQRILGPDQNPDEGLDQIDLLVENIKTRPNSKRLLVQAYDPLDMEECFVTTCHGMFFCQVWGDRLHLHMVQRSSDVPVGVPFNIASYSLLLMMLAQVTGLKPGTFHYTLSDAHVYEHQVPAMRELLGREPLPYCRVALSAGVSDISAFGIADVHEEGYESRGTLKVPVST